MPDVAPTVEITEPIGAEPPVQAADVAPLVDVHAIDAGASADHFARITEALGDLPEEPNETLLAGIDARQIEKLPDSVKGIAKHYAALSLKAASTAKAAYTEKEAAFVAREQVLAQGNADLDKRQREFAAAFQSKEFTDLLKPPEGEEEELDLMTPEGIQKAIERTAEAKMREAMEKFTKPVTSRAREIAQVSDYNDFVKAHPRMLDKAEGGFRDQVAELVRERRAAGAPVSLPDAHDLIEAKVLRVEADARRESARRARAAANEHVSKTSVASDPRASGLIPEWVQTTGYQNQRGMAAVGLYLKDHPKTAAAIRQARTSR